MKVGIIQPSYIPWKGYFDLVDAVDLFVFLDDVQYTRRDWRNRNRINSHSGPQWLTVPVFFSRHDEKTKIQDVRIDNSSAWRKKHIASITQSYRKAPYFNTFSDQLFEIIAGDSSCISDLDIALTHHLMDALGISTRTIVASELNVGQSRDEHLIEILLATGASSYLSGPSAKSYIRNELFAEHGITLEYMSYRYPEYPQRSNSFEHNVSVIDLLFNCGPGARLYFKGLEANEVAAA
ncbi:MAG: WbqC family protein [Pirellulaceae bacterium]|nr:WbqC family protein [Pirellulaceae bacterium]